MPIKKYTVEVTRVDEYQIEIDTDVWNQKQIQDYSSNFAHAENAEDIVMHLAKSISNDGKAKALEGFGNVKQRFHRMEPGASFDQTNFLGAPVQESDYEKGLAVNIIAYEEYDVVELFKTK